MFIRQSDFIPRQRWHRLTLLCQSSNDSLVASINREGSGWGLSVSGSINGQGGLYRLCNDLDEAASILDTVLPREHWSVSDVVVDSVTFDCHAGTGEIDGEPQVWLDETLRPDLALFSLLRSANG